MSSIPKNITQFIQVLDDEHRLQIIASLGIEKKTYTELRTEAGLESNSCAYHIDVLKNAKLIKKANQGGKTFYTLNKAVYKKNVLALHRFLNVK